jgi:hypothetical protein
MSQTICILQMQQAFKDIWEVAKVYGLTLRFQHFKVIELHVGI